MPLAGLAALALAALLLAGCGSDGATSSVPTQTVATDQGSAGASTATDSSTPDVAAPSVGGVPDLGADGSVQFAGVTVTGATDLSAAPGVSSSSATPAPGLLVQDLVVGTGTPATATSSVTVHYSGVLYSDGTAFDSNFSDSAPQPFDLTEVVAGFGQGIGGTDGVEPMRTGGRRLLIFPAALGYGDADQGPIPAGASLVFVVDLLGVS